MKHDKYINIFSITYFAINIDIFIIEEMSFTALMKNSTWKKYQNVKYTFGIIWYFDILMISHL